MLSPKWKFLLPFIIAIIIPCIYPFWGLMWISLHNKRAFLITLYYMHEELKTSSGNYRILTDWQYNWVSFFTKIWTMKKLCFMLLISVLFACNNETTDATTSDSTVIKQDNTINRDTALINDTMYRRDSLNRADSIK